MSAVLYLAGLLAAVGVGYALRSIDARDRIRELEAENASLRASNRKHLERRLQAAAALRLPSRPPWPTLNAAPPIATGVEDWPAPEPAPPEGPHNERDDREHPLDGGTVWMAPT